jgi:hypothetical protein
VEADDITLLGFAVDDASDVDTVYGAGGHEKSCQLIMVADQIDPIPLETMVCHN